ncbi:hypothetical protein DFH94DRAFT_338300 [Russula ochroleuca]|uniref:Secreted protein n=1 Tax=Russula ochroleuca TaxID=152965 RepID=A0A9P5N1M8_9AGAM|nr:hypothetical protein DFH94DRAFT_338300 [Russula ochroleuca]
MFASAVSVLTAKLLRLALASNPLILKLRCTLRRGRVSNGSVTRGGRALFQARRTAPSGPPYIPFTVCVLRSITCLLSRQRETSPTRTASR